MTDLETLQNMKAQVWQVLTDYKIEPSDSKNVIRYEKLAKLHLQLVKAIDRYNESERPENALDEFLMRGDDG